MTAICLAASCDLQALLDDPDVDVIELSGVFVGPYVVSRDVALRPHAGDPAPVLIARDAWLGGPALTATAADLRLSGLGLVGAVVVDGGRASLDAVRFDTTRACVRASGADVEVAGSAFHTCGEGAIDLVGGSLTLTTSAFWEGFAPAVHAVGAARVSVRDTVVDTYVDVGSVDPDAVLWFEDVDAVDIERAWICDALASGLWLEGGCDGGCRVTHTVLTGLEGRVGGAVVWGGAEGTLSRVTITDNRAGDGGGALILRSGALAIDHAVVSDPFASHDTFDVRGGSLFLSDTTVFSTRPGVELAAADAIRPVFLAEPRVPDLCGPGVVPSPVAPGNAPIVAWPEPEGRGALSTDCGPWCVDADGDGSPAMWDCDDADPARGDDLPEVWSDGVDQDCDGADECLADLDGDGVAGTAVPVEQGCAEVPAVLDCDDADPARFPGAVDTPRDGVDSDCDGVDPTAPLPPHDDDVVLARGCASAPGAWWLGGLLLALYGRRGPPRQP